MYLDDNLNLNDENNLIIYEDENTDLHNGANQLFKKILVSLVMSCDASKYKILLNNPVIMKILNNSLDVDYKNNDLKNKIFYFLKNINNKYERSEASIIQMEIMSEQISDLIKVIIISKLIDIIDENKELSGDKLLSLLVERSLKLKLDDENIEIEKTLKKIKNLQTSDIDKIKTSLSSFEEYTSSILDDFKVDINKLLDISSFKEINKSLVSTKQQQHQSNFKNNNNFIVNEKLIIKRSYNSGGNIGKYSPIFS